MFMGVTAHRNVQRVSSYEQAQAVLRDAAKTPKGRQRAEKTYGFALGGYSKSVKWVRKEVDESIVFRLYDTDVITWYPDDSFDVDNFGSVTTSGFASRFTPAGVGLRHEARGGGDCGIYYCTGETEEPDKWGCHWLVHHICFGSVVRFRPDGERWLPDLDTLGTIEFQEPVPGMSRALGKMYPLRDFERFLSMAPLHLELTHEGFDVDECADALLKRDFRRAAVHLPLIAIGRGFGIADRIKPLNIATRWRDEVVTMSSLRKLRIALAAEEGWYEKKSYTTLPLARYEKLRAKQREMEKLGL